ncbi:conserved hypothetical protein [Candidatus Nitrosotenuis uzonensis]|uniref:Uncharacterized protein n=1 Tax=Candidatus Nitrosotenuis uzonensis TaxID=1407055 RepID=A0A812F6M5_9ARCH|nr:conserved hypothetical protein [Candidatus Nitrosotenuis uzonensis]
MSKPTSKVTLHHSAKNNVYPNELDIDQLDAYSELYLFDNLQEAKLCATNTGGQIYTQVDGDPNILYSKGIHLVNRTGIYAVIKSDR